MSPKARKIIGWILTILIAGVMLFAASGKIIGTNGMDAEKAAKTKDMIGAMGYSMDEIRLIGLLEALAALLFIFPRTGVLGTLLLTAYLGGAIATHLEHAAARPGVWGAVIVEAAVWITALIRFPELGARFFGRRPMV